MLAPSLKNLYRDVMLEGHNIEEHCQSQRHGRYIICHSGCRPCEHKGYGKKMYLSLPQQLEDNVVVPAMRRLGKYDTSLQVISFPV